jgi:hypothetical protein
MSNKRFLIIISIVIVGLLAAFLTTNKKQPEIARPGIEQPDKGRRHVAVGQSVEYDTKLPTSGTHSQQPAPWGISDSEIPDETIIHNLEHGGVVITYRPDVNAEVISKLSALFKKPFTNKQFTPTKAILMPKADQTETIVMRSWRRLEKLETYDENRIIQYYTLNIGNSPEPTAS